MASFGHTCWQLVHCKHIEASISAFLSVDLTSIASEGQTFSQSLHPIQLSLFTFSENLANLPKTFCSGPNGQMRLWNTAGLYLSVISTETANQMSKMGIFLCNNFCASNIITTLPPMRTMQIFQSQATWETYPSVDLAFLKVFLLESSTYSSDKHNHNILCQIAMLLRDLPHIMQAKASFYR